MFWGKTEDYLNQTSLQWNTDNTDLFFFASENDGFDELIINREQKS